MTITADRLAGLLPALYRVRDAEAGGPLQALLEVIAASMADLEEEIEQLYDNQFIETASPSVLPWFADLVGARAFGLPVEKDETQPERSAESLRAQIANTVGNRRRRGTAAALEQVARDITGWDAVVVEFFQRLAATQALHHLRPGNIVTADLRDIAGLDRVGSAFEPVTRTVDVRRIASGRGTHNIPNVGIFLWPFRAERWVLSPAFEIDPRRFVLHPLGIDAALRTDPVAERSLAGLAQPLNLPLPISRRAMDAALDDYYGAGRSLLLNVDGVPVTSNVLVADLSNVGADDASGWSCAPAAGDIAVDPVLGRIAFPPAAPPPTTVRASFFAGHRTGMGGGAYERAASFRSPGSVLAQVTGAVSTIPTAIAQVLDGGTIEITDSDRYIDSLLIQANDNAQIELRAANEHFPHLALPDDFEINGDGIEVWLNGLLISGAAIVVGPGVAQVHIRHCTLVPGSGLNRNGTPVDTTAPSLIIEGTATSVEIESSIVGTVHLTRGSSLSARYSVIDATAPDGIALANGTLAAAGGAVSLEQCTVIGKVWTEQLDASDSILFARLAAADPWTSPVRSEKRQEGCVRFSFVPPGSLTPRRYRCQPNAAHTGLLPRFRTLRFGLPDYALLAKNCAPEIAEGGDDGGEMGAFVRLRLRQRVANLRAALPEHLRFGLEAGTFVSEL